MLGKMVVFCFCVLGIYALLMAAMPPEFITAGETYNPSYRSVDVEEEFDANNLIMYGNTGNDNMTYPYTSLEDAPSPPQWSAGLPENNYLEIGWGLEWDYEGLQVIKARHRIRNWFFGYSWYSTKEDLMFYSKTGDSLGRFLYKSTVENYYDPVTNSSPYTLKGTQIATSFIVKRYNETHTIGENWDDGTLQYYLSYQANFSRMDIGAFTIITKLLTFQSLNLGITGTWGTFMNMLIAIPIWSMIAYILYKVVAGLIPWVSGGSGD